jgi:hypothetical protein
MHTQYMYMYINYVLICHGILFFFHRMCHQQAANPSERSAWYGQAETPQRVEVGNLGGCAMGVIL